MRILNHEISSQAIEIYNQIIDRLKLPVKIGKVGKDHSESNGYCLKNDDQYLVYVDAKLRDDVFESVLIHELLHCIQIEKGSPGLIAANYGDYVSKTIASMITSLVADIDVEDKLSSFGMHSDYIDHVRYIDAIEVLKEYSNKNYVEIYPVTSALNLVLIERTSNSSSYYEELYNKLRNQDENIIEIAEGVSNIIGKYGYKTPREQLRSIRRIAIFIGWRAKFRIVYNGVTQEV